VFGRGCHPNVVMIIACADDQTSADAYDASDGVHRRDDVPFLTARS
jgi:hypothetical protein